MQTAAKPTDYVAIRLWGIQLGSFDYYIAHEQEKAAAQAAPIDALYEREGKWTCVSDLKPDHTFRAAYEAVLDNPERMRYLRAAG